MTITQQQALHAVDRLRGAEPAQHLATLRQYIEQSTAQPQAVVPAPPQEFESAQGRALAVAWAEGWAQCRDAEYVGEDAQDEAFNQSATLAQCLHADQTRFQGGLSNDQLRRAWSAKLPNVIPTDEQLTAFALGIEAAAQPSAQAERAPVVQAVQAVELIEQEMAMLIRRLCSTTANDKTRAQAMEYLFKRGHASPLRAESAPAQAMDHPPLPEGVKARFKCEDCDGTGYTGEMIPGSEFQPPEPVGCTSCRFTGWWAECEAYSADQMHAYLDADRASSGAAQAVRMLTREELNDVALSEQVGWGPGEYVEAVQRKFCAVNAGLTIPADGVIGGV